MKICAWTTCDRPAPKQSLCTTHAKRKQIGSPPMDDPIRIVRRGMSVIDRINEQSEQRGDCIIFNGSKTPQGYGKIGIGHKTHSVMKIVWENINGPVPNGMFLRHTCDNPSCISVDHLIIGTPKDNTLDMMTRGRHLNTTFTPEQVRQIRADTRIQEAIAAEYGVDQTTISSVKRRKTYDWVE